ncbi:DUF7341 domain-containing protein [Isoptericola variabilis]|uniref:DUF7341 domain-containing protein n=1 Tax=Isoptericola variabilis TaxID=139208 RepID=UPI003D21050F
MSKHRIERTAQQVTCDRITERVAALVEPWAEPVDQVVGPSLQTDAERQTWHDTPRGQEGPAGLPRVVVRTTTIEHAPLLDQLLHPAPVATAGLSSSGPASRPPTSIEGWAAHQDIQFGTLTWCRALFGQTVPAGPADRLRRLAEHAPTLPDSTLHNLDADVMRWWVLARTVTTWADPPWKPHVPCSECGVLGKIQVRLYPTTAYCLECGAAWDGLTIDQLGAHVQLLAEHAAAAVVEHLIERRPCTTCGQEHDPGDFTDPDVYRAHTPAALVGRTTPDVVGTVTA